MTQVRLSSKYQVVIPEDVRRELELSPGQLFEVFAFGGALCIVRSRPLAEAFGLLASCGQGDAAAPSGLRTHEDRLQSSGSRP